MTDESIPFEEQQAVGAPEGVKNKDLSAGESHQGSKAPAAPSNVAPPKEATAEEKAAALVAETAKKAADEKEAADKATTEKEAADKLAEEEKNKLPDKEYPVYDDPVANSVVNLLKKAGVTPAESDEFFRKAVESGNIADVDLAKLAAKVGKDEADLIMIGVNQYYNTNAAAVKTVVDGITAVFGGKPQTDLAIAWALEKEKTDPAFHAELNEYRKMFDGSPTTARLAAQELFKTYNADPGTKSLEVKITEGDKTGSGLLSLEYITKVDYINKLTEAERKGDKVEVSRLNARRLSSMKQE